ncbi:MAG: hypothetical protein ACOZQL_10850 [Myxococcota bacterium]
MTETELAVLEDLLRSTQLPETLVRRLLFAAAPKHLGEHACALCGVGLEVRPVVRKVRRSGMGVTEPNGTYEKRVHMKPRQVVVELRREGSYDLVEGQSLPRDRLGRGDLAWRFCAACAGSLLGDESASGASAHRPPGETP